MKLIEKIKALKLDEKTTAQYFWCSFLFFVFYSMVTRYYWLFSGEIYAEMATNYWLNAQSENLYIKFFALDSGYLPLLQRILAVGFYSLNISAKLTPYFYVWSAVLLISLSVSLFCLKYFRIICENDFYRFLIAFLILVVSPFETTSFFNFTYYFIFILLALIISTLHPSIKISSNWFYLLPLLFFAKPYFICLIPSLMLGIWFANGRKIKIIYLLCVVVLLLQIAFLISSRQAGVFSDQQTFEYSFFDKLTSGFFHGFGLLAGYIIGPLLANLIASVFSPIFIVLVGVSIFCGTAWIALKKTNSFNILLTISGLSVIFGCALINSFSVSDVWNNNLEVFHGLPFSRHAITAFWASIIVFLGIAKMLKANNLLNFKYNKLIIIIFIIQIYFGYLQEGGSKAVLKKFPMTGVSAWKDNTKYIDDKTKTICIPLDPYGWFFERGCKVLNKIKPFDENKIALKKDVYYELQVTKKAQRAKINGVAVPIFTIDGSEKIIKATLVLENQKGNILSQNTSVKITKKGGMGFFNNIILNKPIKNLAKAKIIFSDNVLLLKSTKNQAYAIFTGY